MSELQLWLLFKSLLFIVEYCIGLEHRNADKNEKLLRPLRDEVSRIGKVLGKGDYI